MRNENTTWVVVANSSQAKIYKVVKFPALEEVASFEHPESRLHDQDLVTSKPGRVFDKGGTTRHAYQTAIRPKIEEAEKFSSQIAHYLAKSIQSGECGRLYLIANPSFLGMINEHLDKETEQHIVAKLAKDFTEFTRLELEQKIQEIV